jgi:transposase
MTKKFYKFYVGIDVGKSKLDVAMTNHDNILQIGNHEEGFKGLVKQLPSKKNLLVVLEASGGYEQPVTNYLRRKKYNVAIVNAKRVRDFAKASGKLAKTDHIDASMIMEFARALCPVPRPCPTADEKARLNYLNRRSQLA